MKRKDLLLITFLLTQTTPLWGMADDEFVEGHEHPYAEVARRDFQVELIGDIIRPAQGNPRGRFQITQEGAAPVMADLELQAIQTLRFEPFLPPHIGVLTPSDLLPQDLGTARERIRCEVNYHGNVQQIETLLPTLHPLQGQWSFQEDRDHTQNIATLKLKALLNTQRLVDIYQRQVEIPHILIDAGIEVPGDYYFNGDTAYQIRNRQQQWRNPESQQLYTRTITSPDGELPTHAGNQIIYASPFAFGVDPAQPREDYRGRYDFVRELSEHEKLPGKKDGSLIYSDGNHIYLPHITQELWRQEHSQVGFFIASYKQDRKLNFISQAQIPHGQLPEGLYQLISVKEELHRHTEKWEKLGEIPEVIEISTFPGVASIPGMGTYAPRIVSNDQTIFEALAMQEKIQEITQKTEEAMARHPYSAGSVIVLGPTGSGKTTLIHALAGSLSAQEHLDEDGDRELRLHADHPLLGFNIGHDAIVGTTIPNLWYDQVNNIFYWDCPGFFDPRGHKEDIINAFSIHRLFQHSSVKVALVSSDLALKIKNERGRHFFKLLNEMAKLFTDETQLHNALSLIVTQGGHPLPPDRLTTLHRSAERAQAEGKEIGLTPSGRRLLSFLQAMPSRVSSLPQPRDIGPYEFDRQHILDCISRAQYIPDPSIDFTAGISDGAKVLAVDLAQGLNQYLSTYMGTEGAQRIINYCRQKIEAYSGPIAALRTEFRTLKQTLKTLRTVSPDRPLDMVNILTPLIDTTDIRKTIEILEFFKRIKNEITYSVGEWSTTLLTAVKDKIKSLTVAPQIEHANGALTIKGTLVGISDINAALRTHPSPAKVNAYGLNTIFIDEDITSHGTSLSLLAPQWKVVGARRIDLSGKAGANGASGSSGTYSGASGSDGQPGFPGGNGGHFYGKGFKFADRLDQLLTVNTNGGNGGNGGRGGDGAAGADGKDGDLGKYTTHGCRQYYSDTGTNGSVGGDAGRGGVKGSGGHCGSLIIEGHQWNTNPTPQDGKNGNDGIPGIAGAGGREGKHCQGIWVDTSSREKGEWGFGYWELERRHQDHRNYNSTKRWYAYDGFQPLPTNLNWSGLKFSPENRLNSVPIIQQYKLYFSQEANNPIVSPFMKVFPNLN
jgi:GTPase SAR1 family protein